MEELISNVLKWAEARNLIKGSNPVKQLDKTSSEFNELQRAVGEYEMLVDLNSQTFGAFDGDMYSAHNRIKDGFGDVMVTMIIAAKQLNLNITDCLDSAYFEIKDRKGKMINGFFVKEADLPPEETTHEFN